MVRQKKKIQNQKGGSAVKMMNELIFIRYQISFLRGSKAGASPLSTASNFFKNHSAT